MERHVCNPLRNTAEQLAEQEWVKHPNSRCTWAEQMQLNPIFACVPVGQQQQRVAALGAGGPVALERGQAARVGGEPRALQLCPPQEAAPLHPPAEHCTVRRRAATSAGALACLVTALADPVIFARLLHDMHPIIW